jgi:hypothetical protein
MTLQKTKLVVGNNQSYCKTGELSCQDDYITHIVVVSEGVEIPLDFTKAIEKISLSDKETNLIKFTFCRVYSTIYIYTSQRELFLNINNLCHHINFDRQDGEDWKNNWLKLSDL